MKVKLLNDGGFDKLAKVEFPVIVNAEIITSAWDHAESVVGVQASDLACLEGSEVCGDDSPYCFLTQYADTEGTECEILK